MKRIVFTIVSFALAAALLYFGSTAIGESSAEENARLAQQAIERAAVQCYALEGFYPRSLEYLNERYGLSINEEVYFVHYQYVADNLAPDITILPRKVAES